MEDLKQAYELLGLQEGADREEVEKRYFLLIRRTRTSKQRAEATGQADVSSSPSLEDVNHAYKLILAAEDQKTNEAFNVNAYGKYKKMAGSAAKVDHFFSYYKFHLHWLHCRHSHPDIRYQSLCRPSSLNKPSLPSFLQLM